ncbi:FAD binding domain-containing protein [Colletotrichum abscissum]|uniref:FAD binding domain-containing protein n=4 Tax=Colletotrichum acutatum species complex TaxID=2707335 RepID=A0A9P9XJS1_9PEZI|nr:FAD binding domain-containing protein [Colletotrichum costaricense]XP_060395810.1 FAD binding domain-containing protein [Colletotrichum abscissum]KAI3547335.1 FAD binding domain-containing protein [Colletotrichum filicis]KAK0381877.1 FAD binding domain-containing protein [Colletotrichum limetticola]KAK1450101.1 FAD binding domain-containing protein [Colletotrichum melonis]KAI3554517.1 FAD binding domain-containing protein [Colletotrichum abscissum]KAK1488497.1 FAD binding domain-containing
MRLSYLAVATALATITTAAATPKQQCHCLPGDSCWPSVSAWNLLNATVGGRLVATKPIGSPCHDPTYDAAACAALQSSWTNPLTHIPSSSSVMQSYFANQSCDPFTDRAVPCTLGNYVSYAVDVRCTADVSLALTFAKLNNLRVVVRNTGHDFLGRSTGAGALAIWTNHLKTIDFSTWSDKYYTGPAVNVGAGVLGYEILEAAHAKGLAVVSGECATVGLAGGFTQGGGHSALSTQFGLGADQTLAFQVVTADGKTVVASATQNTDLYWALSGGGGGTFGVVTGLTVRAYPAQTVGGAAFQLLAATTTPEKFNAAVSKFHELLPAMTDQGAFAVFLHNAQFLVLRPLTVWNSTAAYVRDVVLAPFTKALQEELGITLAVAYSELSYRDHYDRYMGPLPQGNLEVTRYQFGGRLIPREAIENNNAEYQKVVQNLTANGVLLAGSVGHYNKPAGAPENSVHPAWRKAVMQLQLITNWDNAAPWADMEASQKRMTEEFMPWITAVTPGSASYMNEADFRQPDWQNAFFGTNYAKLLTIKKKYDPESLFYVLKGVGSEAWTVAANGQMCRA